MTHVRSARTDPYPGVELLSDPLLKQVLRYIWDRLADVFRHVEGPVLGTLSPDQKPTDLRRQDIGIEFFATDFNRGYRWSGVGWEDSPSAPTRFQVTYFVSSPEPPIGWIRCDGRTGLRSTATGGTLFFQAQVIPNDAQGNQAWMRV